MWEGFKRWRHAISEWWRWQRKIDWELIDVQLTGETRLFPPRDCPFFIETWRCTRTGEVRYRFLY